MVRQTDWLMVTRLGSHLQMVTETDLLKAILTQTGFG